jgi:hypothetical protein
MARLIRRMGLDEEKRRPKFSSKLRRHSGLWDIERKMNNTLFLNSIKDNKGFFNLFYGKKPYNIL